MTSIAIDNNTAHKAEIRKKTAKPLLWVGIMSIVMFFGGLTSAIVVSSNANSAWIAINIPFAFTISTILIVLSSLVFHYGYISIKKGQKNALKQMVFTTLLLGLGFVITQFLGWKALYEHGIVATGSKSTSASSYFYVVTLLHVLHLVGGLVSLIVVFIKSVKERYHAGEFLGVELSLTYWHFLGILWVYLFFFLRYIA